MSQNDNLVSANIIILAFKSKIIIRDILLHRTNTQINLDWTETGDKKFLNSSLFVCFL